jgi:hypothetical protein
VEPDPEKRLNMLVEELSERLSDQWPSSDMPGYTHVEQDDSKYELVVNYQLNDTLVDDVLAHMLSHTARNCKYCRQVKLIKIDKRQLAVHLFSKHFWNVKLSITEKFNVDKGNDEQKTGSIESEDPKSQSETALDAVVQEEKPLPTATENRVSESVPNITSVEGQSTESDKDKTAVGSTVIESGGDEKQGTVVESQTVPPHIEVKRTEDQVNENSRSVNSTDEKMEIDQAIEDIDTLSTIDSEKSLKLEPVTEKCDTNESTDVVAETRKVQPITLRLSSLKNDLIDMDWGDFKLKVLRKVFSSKNVVFSYNNGYEFGEAPCECLLCGYTVDTQKNLFPHWRKIHRGVAMKCAMCQGRFLFAGALFSHLCLGTPNPVVKNEIMKGPSSTGGKNHSLPESNGVGSEVEKIDVNDEDGSADTIVLRYQCNICGDFQLPGFFNYMVHMRKDHIRCELCLEEMKSQKELEHHMKKHKLNHFCWKCGVTYCAKPNFMTHLFWKHGSESKDCSVCLKKKWPHIYHYCVPPTHFVCDVCGFYFTKPKCLMVHKRLHTGEKLKKCPKHNCLEKFISKKLLAKHLEAAHSNLTEAQQLAIEAPEKPINLPEEDTKPYLQEDDMVDSSVKKEISKTLEESENTTTEPVNATGVHSSTDDAPEEEKPVRKELKLIIKPLERQLEDIKNGKLLT